MPEFDQQQRATEARLTGPFTKLFVLGADCRFWDPGQHFAQKSSMELEPFHARAIHRPELYGQGSAFPFLVLQAKSDARG
jgi:hypothetical protein